MCRVAVVVVPLQVRSRHRSRRRRRHTRHTRTQAGGYQFRAGVAQWGAVGLVRYCILLLLLLLYIIIVGAALLYYFIFVLPTERAPRFAILFPSARPPPVFRNSYVILLLLYKYIYMRDTMTRTPSTMRGRVFRKQRIARRPRGLRFFGTLRIQI